MIISFVGEIIYCVGTHINVGGSWFSMYMMPAHLKI